MLYQNSIQTKKHFKFIIWKLRINYLHGNNDCKLLDLICIFLYLQAECRCGFPGRIVRHASAEDAAGSNSSICRQRQGEKKKETHSLRFTAVTPRSPEGNVFKLICYLVFLSSNLPGEVQCSASSWKSASFPASQSDDSACFPTPTGRRGSCSGQNRPVGSSYESQVECLLCTGKCLQKFLPTTW